MGWDTAAAPQQDIARGSGQRVGAADAATGLFGRSRGGGGAAAQGGGAPSAARLPATQARVPFVSCRFWLCFSFAGLHACARARLGGRSSGRGRSGGGACPLRSGRGCGCSGGGRRVFALFCDRLQQVEEGLVVVAGRGRGRRCVCEQAHEAVLVPAAGGTAPPHPFPCPSRAPICELSPGAEKASCSPQLGVQALHQP